MGGHTVSMSALLLTTITDTYYIRDFHKVSYVINIINRITTARCI